MAGCDRQRGEGRALVAGLEIAENNFRPIGDLVAGSGEKEHRSRLREVGPRSGMAGRNGLREPMPAVAVADRGSQSG
jgi:hypothetical protein